MEIQIEVFFEGLKIYIHIQQARNFFLTWEMLSNLNSKKQKSRSVRIVVDNLPRLRRDLHHQNKYPTSYWSGGTKISDPQSDISYSQW